MWGEHMKKNFLIILVLVIIITITIIAIVAFLNKKSPVNSTDKRVAGAVVKERDAREVVLSQLEADDIQKIKGTWQDAKLTKVILKEEMGNINDLSYIGQEVYLVDFPTEINWVPGNMLVYASLDKYTIIGYGITE